MQMALPQTHDVMADGCFTWIWLVYGQVSVHSSACSYHLNPLADASLANGLTALEARLCHNSLQERTTPARTSGNKQANESKRETVEHWPFMSLLASRPTSLADLQAAKQSESSRWIVRNWEKRRHHESDRNSLPIALRCLHLLLFSGRSWTSWVRTRFETISSLLPPCWHYQSPWPCTLTGYRRARCSR